ncbi:DUF998 domain-containing protein [Sphaerisporangium dianthi]|uniref:DUF998 domain-containing protein n=1 Tax=Sphaerisporangium dianthi TaxID=1436120 RepID=A0ABV9CUD4_9ACTN
MALDESGAGARRAGGAVRRGLVAFGVAGPPLFVAVFLLEGSVPGIRPAGYSALRHPVSSLAIGELGWIQVANFLMVGLSLLVFAFALRPAMRLYAGGIWVPLLVALVGVGLVGSALFVTDPWSGYPPGSPPVPEGAAGTVHGMVHGLFGTLVFLGLPVAALVACYRFARSGHRWFAVYSAVSAVVFLVGFALASQAFAQAPGLVAMGGLLQRLTLVVGMAWLTALALRVLRDSGGGTVRDSEGGVVRAAG